MTDQEAGPDLDDLPKGWARATLGELVEVLDGRRVPVNRAERAERSGDVPYYGATGQVGWIDQAIFDEDLLLLGEDGVQFLDPDKQKAYLISGPAWVNNHAHVLRAREHVCMRAYLCHYLNSASYQGFVGGSTRLKLTQADMKRIAIPVPPLAEQRRIIEALDVQLSRLDLAQSYVQSAQRRATTLYRQLIVDAVPLSTPAHWRLTTVAEAGEVDLGRQRHPDWHDGPNMRPYLRVANVFEDRIDATDLMEMDFPPDVFDRFRLSAGDILLNEGQSPIFLGRPAMYRGEPENVAFTNSLLRFRCAEGVDPEWALLVFRRHLHTGRFVREVRITTNIAHLSAGRFKSVEFPIPPLGEQREITQRTAEQLTRLERLSGEMARLTERGTRMRRALLALAFAGRLAPQSPDDRPASELLSQIREAHAATTLLSRSRSSSTRASAPRSTTAIPVGVQEELPL